jgi:hypothetical protein
MEPPEGKSVHAMTNDERRELLRRREAHGGEGAMEIGGPAAGRRVIRWLGVSLMTLATAAVFVVAFYHFTASWRVAALVVGAMLAYMIAVGRMVEGRADRID